jgi:hypothetical protein
MSYESRIRSILILGAPSLEMMKSGLKFGSLQIKIGSASWSIKSHDEIRAGFDVFQQHANSAPFLPSIDRFCPLSTHKLISKPQPFTFLFKFIESILNGYRMILLTNLDPSSFTYFNFFPSNFWWL